MSFNYSYRAFIITSLLTGILVLVLISIKLSGVRPESMDESHVVMGPEEIIEDKEVIPLPSEKVEIETNRAYNEAEKYISSIENENRNLTETTEGKLQEMEDAMENSKMNVEDGISSEPIKTESKSPKELSNSESQKEKVAIVEGGNRNTTISYRLLNRRDMYLPNPVYTCYGSGRVVINIEVDSQGKVKRGSYNQASSSTSNQCLVDAATEYALLAEFTSDASRTKQLGTITFNFPGQH